LIGSLLRNEESEWREYHQGGKEITARDLSRLLKPMGIEPTPVRIGGAVQRGYRKADFDEAFKKYLEPL